MSPVEFLDAYMEMTQDSVRSATALESRRAMFASSCSACDAGADVAEQLLQTGLEVGGGQVTHRTTLLRAGDSLALVNVTYSISRIELRDDSGRVVQSAPESRETSQVFQLKAQEDDSWIIVSADPSG